MEGLAPLLILIISIVSALAKSKKNKVPAKRPNADAEKRLQEIQAYMDKSASAKREEQAAAPASAGEGAAFSSFSSISAPAPARMGVEGEDACHEYMLEDASEEEKAPADEARDPEQAKDLVKAVVMSEILNRPHAWGRRRA